MATMANPDYITQVIYNLIDKCREVLPRRGQSGGCASKRAAAGLYVSVSNDGETIPPDELPLVFDRFHKLDKSAPRTGTAGDWVCTLAKTIVCSHGEDISVSSRTETEFTFTMPLVN